MRYCFKVFFLSCQVYHLAGGLRAADGEPEKFMQIYFMGSPEEEVNRRLGYNPNLRENVVFSIQEALHQTNPYVQQFKSAIESMDPSLDLTVNIKADRTPQGQHRGRFNEQKCNEIAVIVSHQESGSKRDIIIRSKGGDRVRVSEFHPG